MKYIIDTYTLESLNSKYFISFKDFLNNLHKLEISKEVFDEYINFKKISKKISNEFDRHIEHLYLNENTLNHKVHYKEKSVEKNIIKNFENNKLYQAINLLPKNQKERIILYYFKNKSKKEIAKIDNCSIRAVQYSIDIGIKNLKKYIL